MGDVSIIARRLTPEYVQYGWGGNGGYFRVVGLRLSLWYTEPEDVEYLFGLGQTKLIGQKGSENGGFSLLESHHLTGEPFWLGKTEREIFSKIAFIDYGYFYDLDNKWYYIIPGPFRIKMPLELIEHCIETAEYEFDYCDKIKHMIVEYIFNEYKNNDPDFANLLKHEYDDVDSIVEGILESDRPIYKIFKEYKTIFEYFDDWILITTDDSGTEVKEIIMRKNEEQHLETYLWLNN